MNFIEIYTEVISPLLNLILIPAVWVSIATMKSIKKEAVGSAEKAVAEAQKVWKEVDAREIENVDAVAKMWREMAETLAENHAQSQEQYDHVMVEVRRLKNATNRVARLLDKITPENMSEMLEEIKREINHEASNETGSIIDTIQLVQGSPPNIRSPN